ncbi:hypothetical protein TC41_2956 [Alicyclobacillus acidocaldarius subsp. acidocaldarius Tc-4-1]|uniref:Uncharacterized protein n=1 Tax=Alicyclobacillus acidocaldarius (strain Tc-4-1) TaxID=1048834 RepID=F8IKS9_ALIAT|nr:hypothetical protein TC41_2956 [Alicyclobacillus acidocaldarius subsp. acidocaldarius Tc-4-1]
MYVCGDERGARGRRTAGAFGRGVGDDGDGTLVARVKNCSLNDGQSCTFSVFYFYETQ